MSNKTVMIVGGIILCFLACIVPAGSGAVCCGMMGFILFGAGFFVPKKEIKGKAVKIILATIALALILFIGVGIALEGGKGGSSTRTATCKSCGRTFDTGSSNARSIARTGMCNNCYSNFKWGQDALGK